MGNGEYVEGEDEDDDEIEEVDDYYDSGEEMSEDAIFVGMFNNMREDEERRAAGADENISNDGDGQDGSNWTPIYSSSCNN